MDFAKNMRALKYAKFFSQAWSSDMHVDLGLSDEMRVNGECIGDEDEATDALLERLMAYALNDEGITSLYVNVAITSLRYTAFSFIEKLGQSWFMGRLKKLKVYGHDGPFPQLRSVMAGSAVTHLTLKGVLCDLAECVRPLIHLTHFCYSEWDLTAPYESDEDKVGGGMVEALQDKQLTELRLVWVRFLTTNWALAVLRGIRVVENSFKLLKITNCARVYIPDLGLKMPYAVKQSLQVLKVYTNSFHPAPIPHAHSFGGYRCLRFAHVYHQPPMTEDDCYSLVTGFSDSIVRTANEGNIFDLGVRCGSVGDAQKAMDLGVIKEVACHDNNLAATNKPYYTYEATLRNSDAKFLLHFRMF